MWVWLLKFLFRPLHESCCLEKLTSELRNSSLLTNEDHHLLRSALAYQHVEGHTQNHTSRSFFPSCSPKRWYWWRAIAVILSVFLSIMFSATSSLIFFKILILFFLLISLLLVTWYQALDWWVELRERWAKHDREEYYRAFDCLLDQLSATIRWLQEVKVSGQGFKSHAQLHECFLLKSSRLVHVLRAATRRVHRQVRAFGSGQGWLTEKLLYRQSYLAFTNLTHLHPYFTEEEDNEEEDHQGEESSGSREGEALQLDSLKDICSLVGVQNSELLRLLCLSVALANHRLSGQAGNMVGMAGDVKSVDRDVRGLIGGIRIVRWLSMSLSELVKEIDLVTEEVASALAFDQNLEPPSTPPVIDSATEVTSNLQGVLIHIDLKTYCLLHRVRSLNESLRSGKDEVRGLEVEVEDISVCVRDVINSCDELTSIIQEIHETHKEEEDNEEEEEEEEMEEEQEVEEEEEEEVKEGEEEEVEEEEEEKEEEEEEKDVEKEEEEEEMEEEEEKEEEEEEEEEEVEEEAVEEEKEEEKEDEKEEEEEEEEVVEKEEEKEEEEEEEEVEKEEKEEEKEEEEEEKEEKEVDNYDVLISMVQPIQDPPEKKKEENVKMKKEKEEKEKKEKGKEKEEEEKEKERNKDKEEKEKKKEEKDKKEEMDEQEEEEVNNCDILIPMVRQTQDTQEEEEISVAESEGNQDGKVAASSIPGLNMNKLDSDSFEVMSYVHEGHLWSKDVETEEGVEDEQNKFDSVKMEKESSNVADSARVGGVASEMDYMQDFTDEDFKYGAGQFDVDYLEGISSEASAESELARKSLFVKFDPLVSSAGTKPTSAAAARLAEINKRENDFSPVEKPKKKRPAVSFASDLLVMDTPPRSAYPLNTAPKDSPLVSKLASPVGLLSDMTAMAQSASVKMYTEEEVAEMIEQVKLEEIENVAKKYGPELSALRQELASLVEAPGDAEAVDEFQLVDVVLTSEQNVLEKEREKWKMLVAEHERLETLLVFYHEKLKEKFLALAEKRDSMLNSDKIKAKSFEDLQQRYLKLQAAAKKLYKAQGSLATFKKKTKETNESLKNLSEECLLKQDELNRSCEALQNELMSKSAAERVLAKALEMQVRSLEKNMEQKENEKQELTKLAQVLMQRINPG